jgi:hypothetical protein
MARDESAAAETPEQRRTQLADATARMKAYRADLAKREGRDASR